MNPINFVILIAISLAVVFLLAETLIIPRFNASYNTSVTGLSSSTLQGILLLVFFLGMIGIAIKFLPKIGK